MIRVSSHISSLVTYTNTSDVLLHMSPVSAASSSKPPPAKWAKTKAGTKKEKQGHSIGKKDHVDVLTNLPIDILFEVRILLWSQFRSTHLCSRPQMFGYLTPQDLLHLCRTSKPFRQVLLARSATTFRLWKSSWQNIQRFRGYPPPPCPEGWSDPAWAGLLFGGEFCQVRCRDSHFHLKPLCWNYR